MNISFDFVYFEVLYRYNYERYIDIFTKMKLIDIKQHFLIIIKFIKIIKLII